MPLLNKTEMELPLKVMAYNSGLKTLTRVGLFILEKYQVLEMNDSTKRQFLTVIDNAIAEANSVIQDAKTRGVSWLEEDASMAKNNFEEIKKQLLTGELSKSDGAGLGITRALSEMGAPYNLYKAGKELEDFYLSNWK